MLRLMRHTIERILLIMMMVEKKKKKNKMSKKKKKKKRRATTKSKHQKTEKGKTRYERTFQIRHSIEALYYIIRIFSLRRHIPHKLERNVGNALKILNGTLTLFSCSQAHTYERARSRTRKCCRTFLRKFHTNNSTQSGCKFHYHLSARAQNGIVCIV